MIYGITKDEKKKPAIIKLYDFTKGGTDVVDMCMQTFSVKPKCRRWTMAALSYLLDTARVNSQTVHAMNNKTNVLASKSFERVIDLGQALILDHVRRRYTEKSKYLESDVRYEMSKMLGANNEIATTSTAGSENESKSCHMCRNDNKGTGTRPSRSKLRCSECRQATCSRHIPYSRCRRCHEKIE